MWIWSCKNEIFNFSIGTEAEHLSFLLPRALFYIPQGVKCSISGSCSTQFCECINSEPVWHQFPQWCRVCGGICPNPRLFLALGKGVSIKPPELFPVQLSQLHKLVSCHFLGILRVRVWAKISDWKRIILFIKHPATSGVREEGV